MAVSLTLSGEQHAVLERHLFPGDGLEAVAVALCGRRAGIDHRLLVHQVVLVPHRECVRSDVAVTWPTEAVLPLLKRAAKSGMAILKIHSHPGGGAFFSEVDDRSDSEFFPSVHGWTDGEFPHASAIMLPGGQIIGRAHNADGSVEALAQVSVVGSELHMWRQAPHDAATPEYAIRHVQAFGRGTFAALRNLSVAVVGCSGTGSVVVDQLARLGVGRLVLVDPDIIEEKNLNRILNAGTVDVGKPKVEVMRDFVGRLPMGTVVHAHRTDLADPCALHSVAGCDVAFGCMDSVDGRALLNRITTYYLLGYFDVGVRLDADGTGGVSQICGSVHYLQPGGSSLLSRGLYTEDQLRAASMRRHDPVEYERELEEGYLRGVEEDRPAVNSVNMLYASLAVMELLARLHDYRIDGNEDYAVQTVSLTAGLWRRIADGEPDPRLTRAVGRGDCLPTLGLPFLDTLGRGA